MNNGVRRILFRLANCPYCQRVEKYLDQKGIQYEKFEVNNDRSIVKILSGQNSVPVMVEVVGCKDQDDDILTYFSKDN